MAPMIELTDSRRTDLFRWNIGLTVLHAAQAALILALAGGFTIALTTTPPQGPPGTRLPDAETLVDVRIGYVVALFLALAAADHLITATVGRSNPTCSVASTASAGSSIRSAPP